MIKKESFKDINLTYRENNLKDVVLGTLSLNGATKEETIKVCKFILIYHQ